MPKKQKLENKGNYVGNLNGKIQEQRLQDDGTRGSFSKSCQTRVRVVTFVETLGSHLKIVWNFCASASACVTHENHDRYSEVIGRKLRENTKRQTDNMVSLTVLFFF